MSIAFASPYAELDEVEAQLLADGDVERAARALGEAWNRVLLTEWRTHDRPVIVGFPRVRSLVVDPRALVEVAPTRVGWLRDVAERHDLRHRERHLAWLIEREAALRAQLEQDVGFVLDRPLQDFANDVQAAVIGAPADLQRRVRVGATIALGEAVRAHGGAWAVHEVAPDVGRFAVGDWRPGRLVDDLDPADPPHRVAEAVANAIAAHRRSPAPGEPRGTYVALCPRGRARPLAELVPTDLPDGTTVHVDGEQLRFDIDDPFSGRQTTVWVTVRSDVADLRDDVLDQLPSNVDPRPWADADRIYEVAWPLEFSDEAYNEVLLFAERLERDCGALVFDPGMGRFPLL